MPLVYTYGITLRANPGIVSRVNSLKFGNRSKSTNFPKKDSEHTNSINVELAQYPT